MVTELFVEWYSFDVDRFTCQFTVKTVYVIICIFTVNEVCEVWINIHCTTQVLMRIHLNTTSNIYSL